MNFIDLKNLSIVSYSNKKTNKINLNINFDLDQPAKKQIHKLKQEVNLQIIPNLSKLRPNLIIVNIINPYQKQDIIELYEVVSDVICQELTTTTPRDRERRLAVSDTFENCDLKYITLLQMINYKTNTNLFNIIFEEISII